jgi:hypothetical protein
VHRPVHRVAAGDVARADHGVGAGVDELQQLGEDGGVVGEVDVHRHHHVVVLVQGLSEAGAIGAAEALLARAAEQLDLAELGRSGLDDLTGAVRAVVVHDEDVGVPHGAAHRAQQAGDVLLLVVGRHHHDGPPGARRVGTHRGAGSVHGAAA